MCISRVRVSPSKSIPHTRDVFRGEEKIELTYKEFELLKLLMENADRVMTRSELLNLVWGIDFEGETRTLDMHIRTPVSYTHLDVYKRQWQLR